jgi:hypothetical protein
VSLCGNLRLLLLALGLVQAWLIFGLAWLEATWLAVPAGAFVVLTVVQELAVRQRERGRRAGAFYEHGLARLEDHWQGTGEPGEGFLRPEHPYAADLDLFGRGALFELLCTSRTRAGEQTLAAWLLGPADSEEVRARQAAVAELRPRLDLREDLSVLGEEVHAQVDPTMLAGWGAAPIGLRSGLGQVLTYLLPLLTLAAALGWLAGGAGPVPLLAALAAQGVFGWWLRPQVESAVRGVDRAGRDLALLAKLLARLECESVAAQKLRALQAALSSAGEPPSRRIAKLARLIDWLNARRNQFFAPLGVLLLWTTRLAFHIDAWRATSGLAIGRWLAAVGEWEALSAFAAYAYEHPEDPFPEIVTDGPALFDGAGLGHPLLPNRRCVRNDVALADRLRVLVVSGSNMSGKSTLLRTVGVNAVLALAGAPVRASRLRLSPLAVGATLRIQDSLQAGKSRFYAEISRVKQLVDMTAGPVPLLFLLDEVFHGTNSHDRRLGAEAVVRGLIERGAIGLVTTHDLALADIADRLAPRAANVHFADSLRDGSMVFDYRMRPGVVRHSNALALMRAVGLDV